MTVLEAFTLLICLAMVSIISSYPVGMPQTAENIGRGRSYPLIISHYSNVRNSKYNSPAATEAPVVKESDDLNEDDDMHNPSASLLNADESKKDEEVKEVEADEKNENEKSELAEPNMVNADSVAVSKNESISVVPAGEPVVAAEDSLLVSKTDVAVVPSNEKTEVIDELKLTEGTADPAVKESDSTGATLTNVKEEGQTTGLNETEKPAALGDSASTIQIKTTIEMNSDSVAEIQANATEPIVPEISAKSASNEGVKTSGESTTVKVPAEAAIVDEATPESSLIETSRTAVLATDKTSEFFEDRSFKDRPDPELILQAIRQGAAVFGVGEEPKSLPSQIDDVANEGIRLQRDDNKKTTEKKEKEKEKYSAKPTKEKKPIKPMQSNDPVQEYDEVATRAGKSNGDLESTTDTTDVIDKAQTSEEPITLSSVPSNYPVVLASGESTLSDRITPENAESSKDVVKTAEEPSTISLTPTNYPVVLPSGESTLSDTITLEETKSSASEEPMIISLVPSNYPVVLPSGVSTLSDRVKPEDLESSKAEKTVQK